ncbi:MAG: aa3-type cytochrome c oxidase subunit IV [Bauldia sp.]|uniref:aa3-type cytochrome c oxidase subunit IV n=1 Tax=Bauldia sp. TaxID=2575872 RepID=UPI001DDF033B|nr:aa3-type cytochrome c oxidase subunit IV [Bauldia sp.]MCB1496097.1 aa3-type cytochrome c oxidase subunit IV [Bauldia sp.]
MAQHVTAELETATGTEYADHLRTYEGFIHLAKYGTIAVVIILILMAFFLL